MRNCWVIILICLSLIVPQVSVSQQEQVVVQQAIIGDVIPPTVPTGVTATSTASSQIEVSWTASTDSVGIGGYVVYRDGTAIATTSLLTFSDTGLTASTTYTYYVVAFDNSKLYSAQSGTASATTPALPEPEEPTLATSTDNNAGTLLQPNLTGFTLRESETSVSLSWSTNIYVRYNLTWGQTSEYGLGAVQNDIYRRSHRTTIPSLEPGTTYFYQLTGINARGDETVLREGSFVTVTPPDVTPPPNVGNLQAETEARGVRLTWELPVVDDLAYIRVLRNNFYYPLSPTDGYVLFEGVASEVIDVDAFFDYDQQYYTVFSYDRTGNISSGAVTFVVASGVSPATTNQPVQVVAPPFVPPTTATTATATEPTVKPPTQPSEAFGVSAISFADILFIQEDEFVVGTREIVELSSDYPFTIQVPVELLPSRFRSLVVAIGSGQRVDEYLLRLNRDGTAYETGIGRLPPNDHDAYFYVRTLAGDTVEVSRGVIRAVADEGYVRQAVLPPYAAFLIQNWWLLLLALLLVVLGVYRRAVRK